MPFAFKLSQRLARSHWLMPRTTVALTATAAAVLFGGCESSQPTAPGKNAVPTVQSVSITPSIATPNALETQQLHAVLLGSAGDTLTGPSVVWSSSDTTIASVDSTGLVAARIEGSTTVLATSQGQMAAARVNVGPSRVASVTVSPSSATITASQTQQLTATLRAKNGSVLTGRTVTWTSSDSSIAVVASTGLVTARAVGSAIVTATSGSASGTASITVVADPPAPVAMVTVSPNASNILVGQSVQLAATAKDSVGNVLTGRTVTWSTNNSAAVTINATGVATAAAAGNATITAMSEGKIGTATVNAALVPVASVSVSPATPAVRIGATIQLTATTKDSAGNTLTGRTVTWASGTPGVATVSSNGRVTGVATGSSVITATSEGKNATVTVSVSPAPVVSVTVSPGTASLLTGATLQLAATATDSLNHAVSSATFTWSSSTSATATVSSSGLVTAVAAGTTNISASYAGKSGSSVVNVTTPVSDGTCAPTGPGICRYVDVAAGSDANPGTSTQPYKTLQKAANVVNPGDMVIVRDGIYTVPSGTFAVMDMGRGGTASNYVVFRAEHQWGAIIDGQTNTTAVGIRFNANYERVEGFEVRGIQHDGIDMGSGLTGLQAAGLHVHDVGRMCNPPSGEGLSAYTLDDNNVLIEQNLIHDIGRYGPGENGCNPPNTLYQNQDHGIYLSSGSNITIRNNIFYNIKHGWAVHRYNTGGAGTDQVYIVNNTFAFPNPWRDGQIVIGDPLTNSVIANNIFYQPTTAGIWYDAGTISNVTVSHNITYGGPTWEGSTSGTSMSGNMDNTNPVLVNASGLDFHLAAGSPAIGAGLALPYVPNDFAGTIRPSGLPDDIGAYKY